MAMILEKYSMDYKGLVKCFGEPVAVFNNGNTCFVRDFHKVKKHAYLLYERDLRGKWYSGTHLTDEAIKALGELPLPSTNRQ